MRIFGKGFNFSQDGPGNRLVYHLSGCNMSCIWCSNPEGMAATAGKVYDIRDILAEAVSCKPMFFGGGGVTFTGGEATLQHKELLSLLGALKEEGIHTAIETNGTLEALPELLPYIDYLIMDFKHYDSERLREFTGIGNEVIKRNFEKICSSGRQAHIRIPVIGGVNADGAREFAEYFASHNTEAVVFELLPYHEYGRDKWKSEYKMKGGFVTEQTLQSFREAFTEVGLKLVKT